jgi:hypothetical protein
LICLSFIGLAAKRSQKRAFGKQRRVPSAQALTGQRMIVMPGRIEHHFHNTVHMTVHWRRRADIQSQSARNGGAHLFAVQLLALNLAGLDHIPGKRCQPGLVTQLEAEGFHSPDQPPLVMSHPGQRRCQPPCIESPRGPIAVLPNIGGHFFSLRKLCGIYRL